MKMLKCLALVALVACAVAGIVLLGDVSVAHAATYGAATVLSVQLTEDNRIYPIDNYGKLRVMRGYYKNETGGTLAAGTEIDMFDLPGGRCRILPNLSRVRSTALGAARTLDVGLRAYYPSNNPGTVEAEDDDILVDGKDVSAAVNDAALDGGAAKMKYDVYSRGAGPRVFATVDAGTIPANAEIELILVIVVE